MLVTANIRGVSPAERIELTTAIEDRLGDQVVSLAGDVLTVRTDNRARVAQFIQGFGGRLEGKAIDHAVAMIVEGSSVEEAIRYLSEIPAGTIMVPPDPRESCPEGQVWDKTIGECRPTVGSQ